MDELGYHLDSPREFEAMADGGEMDFALANARAILEAMRDPTDGMYAAYRCDDLWRNLNSHKVWQLWIDAALNETRE